MVDGRGGRSGFTLVEVLVATTVLALGITAGVRALGAMARSSSLAADRTTAVGLAGERLALLEAAVDAEPGTLGVELADAQGDFVNEPRFQWQQRVTAAVDTDLLEATVTISWRAGALERRYEVTTYLPNPPQETEGSDQNGTGTGNG